jgi:hypothetical protein
MPKFTVLCRQDAYIDYVATIEADTAEAAAWAANEAPGDYKWRRQGEAEFDAALYVALDEDGSEIAGTECGKCA